MNALLKFSDVKYEKISALSFTLAEGEIAVLITTSNPDKAVVMELALGEKIPEVGSILFNGKPLEESIPGNLSWIPANGGIIGNLKAWENITLPLWYHGKRTPAATEEIVGRWLHAVEPNRREWTDFMACPSARLEARDRKLAGLLRGLVLAPKLLVVDADLFDNIAQADCHSWMAALEIFVQEANDRAVLVVSDGTVPLHWKTISSS